MIKMARHLIIAENKPHAHQESSLNTTKVYHTSFHAVAVRNAWYFISFCGVITGQPDKKINEKNRRQIVDYIPERPQGAISLVMWATQLDTRKCLNLRTAICW